EARVAGEGAHPAGTARVARLFLKDGGVAELAPRGESGVGRGHPARDVPLGGTLEVLAHLGLHIVVERAAQEDGAQAEHRPPEGIGYRHSVLDLLVESEVSGSRWCVELRRARR